MRLPLLLMAAMCACPAQTAPVRRALDYLAAEVPRWRTENGCFSCHNNGDGARALYAGGLTLPAASTSAWLRVPADWSKGKMDGPGSDRKLALYQFSAALVSASEAGVDGARNALSEAARMLVSAQRPDGSWYVEDEGESAGSPVTWGTTLATYFGRRTLLAAGGFADEADRAEKYLRGLTPRYTPDEAAVLLALPRDAAIRSRAVARFTREQTSDGGWGPSAAVPAEVFDTALVLLALQGAGERALIDRGRQFLLRMQQAPGGWPETTRPPGAQSYAQHVSTTAWAAMALLATEPKR
jgi:hypothetical protein